VIVFIIFKFDLGEQFKALTTMILTRVLAMFARGRNKKAVVERSGDAPSDSDEVIEDARRLFQAGALDAARERLERVIQTSPGAVRAHALLGSVLCASGQLRQGQGAFDQALSLDPNDVEALSGLGNVLRLDGRTDAAELHYLRALSIDPRNRAVRYNFALLLDATGRAQEALDALTELIAVPAWPAAVRSIVSILDRQGQVSSAIEILQTILVREPDHAAAHAGMGFLLLKRVLDPDRAMEHLDRALALEPADSDSQANRAIALQDLGRLDDALHAYGMALIRFHRALALLLLSRYSDAWPEYELRLKDENRLSPPPISRPVWNGEAVRGRTMLVHAEQGIGDEIMFASCIPDIVATGARVIVSCSDKLLPLFRRSFRDVTCIGVSEAAVAGNVALESVDCMVPIGSLPARFRLSLGMFPQHTGYLRADPDLVAEYRSRLNACGPLPKIGISWRGGTRQSRQALRTLPPEQLDRLLAVEDVQFVNLQYDSAGDEPEIASLVRSGKLVHIPEALANYDHTAALVCALDLTVSVCTAVIHLAGALGRVVWIMAPHVPEWRYGLYGESMPWYPSARVFRQPQRGDWASVVSRVCKELRAGL
jgi:tetratricopeptide (TPR) repeat protein